METNKDKKTLSIKGKLILIGMLFLVSLILIEVFSSHTDSKVESAIDLMSLRQSQVKILGKLETALLEFTLAGMDAIIDKGSGGIAAELMKEMAEARKFCSENIPKLEEIADTDEEKRLARAAIDLYPSLEKALMTDLPRLISSGADQGAFDEIDDRIDDLAGKIDVPLMKIIDLVVEENREATETMHHQIAAASTIRRSFMAVMLTVIGATLFFISRGILSPIVATTRIIKDIAEGEGDLTKRLDAGGDEIGEMSRWFNLFLEKLQGIIKEIADGVETLASSSTELSAISDQMTQGIQTVSDKSNTVSAAAEEMSANMNTVAAAMEQSSTNTNMVATASEEMSSTIGEIAQNAEKARGISGDATHKATSASTNMDQLGNAANSIGKVVETIAEISEQVNLLALNATIEAARAGEAGKGFAVVANEIKELAKQTAEASQDIKEKIEGIQGTTSTTVGQISEITQVITNVNEVVSTIATAVEQQSAATKEIALNVAQASKGIQEVNENVNQSSSVSGEISEDIAGVSVSMNEMSSSSSQVNLSAQELSTLSENLKNMVDQFKV